MTTDTHRSQYRLPWPLHAKLEAAAKENGRSVNAEMVVRLEASFGPGFDLEGILASLLEEHEGRILEEIRAMEQRLTSKGR